MTEVPLVTDAFRKAGLSEYDASLIMGENVITVLSQNVAECALNL